MKKNSKLASALGYLILIPILVVSILLCTNFDLVSTTGSGAGNDNGTLGTTYQKFIQVNKNALTPQHFISINKLNEAQKLGDFGNNETIAFLEGDSSFDFLAFKDFCKQFKITFDSNNIKILDSGKLKSPNINHKTKLRNGKDPSKEVMMDVEWAHVVAPKAKLIVISQETNSTDQIVKCIDDNHVNVLSVSRVWSTSVAKLPFPYLIDELSKHVAIFQGSGDQGPWINPSAVTPQVVIVGGSEINPYTNKQEIWNSEGQGSAVFLATGSTLQRKIVSHNQYWRSIPDVIWQSGYPGVAMETDHGWNLLGGTSLSTPLWAGLWVLGDAAHFTSDNTHLSSDANDILYNIASSQPNAYYRPTVNKKWGLGIPNSTNLIKALSHYNQPFTMKHSFMYNLLHGKWFLPYRYVPLIILAGIFLTWLIHSIRQKNPWYSLIRLCVLCFCVVLINQVVMRIPTQVDRYSIFNPRLQVLIQLILVTILMAYYLPPSIYRLFGTIKSVIMQRTSSSVKNKKSI